MRAARTTQKPAWPKKPMIEPMMRQTTPMMVMRLGEMKSQSESYSRLSTARTMPGMVASSEAPACMPKDAPMF